MNWKEYQTNITAMEDVNMIWSDLICDDNDDDNYGKGKGKDIPVIGHGGS
jgi:hypothetical protein